MLMPGLRGRHRALLHDRSPSDPPARDWPVTLVATIGCMHTPNGYFDRNPAPPPPRPGVSAVERTTIEPCVTNAGPGPTSTGG